MNTTNKEQRLVVRLTETEHNALKEFAAKHNTTVSHYIRLQVFEPREPEIKKNEAIVLHAKKTHQPTKVGI